MIFISGGHCNTPGPNYDPGAIGVNGRKEADETVKMRDAVIYHLRKRGAPFIQDRAGESLKQYLKRINTGTGSLVVEYHFNAANGSATGVEVLVQSDADKMDKACAKELCEVSATFMGIKNRGVKSEADSHHGRLALMREQGIVVLVELCFIDNPEDMAAYDSAFNDLAEAYAGILIKYDAMMQ